MNLQVTTQVSFVVEGFPALGTICCELLCSTMYRHVVLEVAELGKLLATLAALIFWLQVTFFVYLWVVSLISFLIKISLKNFWDIPEVFSLQLNFRQIFETFLSKTFFFILLQIFSQTNNEAFHKLHRQ